MRKAERTVLTPWRARSQWPGAVLPLSLTPTPSRGEKEAFLPHFTVTKRSGKVLSANWVSWTLDFAAQTTVC